MLGKNPGCQSERSKVPIEAIVPQLAAAAAGAISYKYAGGFTAP
jgi:hypothetical protein